MTRILQRLSLMLTACGGLLVTTATAANALSGTNHTEPVVLDRPAHPAAPRDRAPACVEPRNRVEPHNRRAIP